MIKITSVLTALSLTAAVQAQTDSMQVVAGDTTMTYINTTPYPARSTPRDGEVFRIKARVDIPLTAASVGFTMWGFSKIYNKDRSSEAEVRALRTSDINGFDRWAADLYSPEAATASDYIFYGSMPAPLLLLADKAVRKDAAKIGLLYLEAMGVTGVFYTGTNYLVNRYRPLTYNPEVPIGERTSGGSKNSFIGGHPALVATATFFSAKVYATYHPNSSFRHVLYGAAAVSTGLTAYLRHRAGKHFPSDLIAGTAIGTLSGILVPHFHKTVRNTNLTFAPYLGQGSGVAVTYHIK